MMIGKEVSKVEIDGVYYILDDLFESAKSLAQNIIFIDEQISQLQNEWAISNTARNGYLRLLAVETSSGKNVDA